MDRLLNLPSLRRATGRSLAPLGFGAVLVLAACAQESAETLQTALDAPAAGLGYVAESEGTCVSNAVVTTIGFEELVEGGFTSETIGQNPTDSMTQILEMESGSDVRDAVLACVDTNRVARAQVAEFVGEDLDCETDFAGSALGELAIQTAFDGETLDEIADITQNRNFLRPCFSEAVFAETFGLDTRDELEVAIEATFGEQLRTDGELCAAPLLIDHFGSAEEANDAGVTVESPAVELHELDLEPAERSNLLSAILSCSSVPEIFEAQARMSEPSYADCIVERFNEEFNFTWRKFAVEEAFGVTFASDAADRQWNSARSACVLERINDVYGSIESGTRTHAQLLADDAYRFFIETDPQVATYGFTEIDLQCAAVEVVNEVDLFRLNELIVEESTGNPSAEVFDLSRQYVRALQSGYSKCAFDPLYALAPALHRNFSPETIACSDREVGDAAALIDSFSALDLDATLTEAEYFLELAALRQQFLRPIEDCLGSDEVAMFDAWMAWFFADQTPLELGEPESLST